MPGARCPRLQPLDLVRIAEGQLATLPNLHDDGRISPPSAENSPLIDYFQLLDANVGALVGICSVWLAIGRGHWFVRFLVVVPLLLAPILIDAYDMFYHHAFGTMLIVAGIGAYQHWRPWQWRFSTRSILLAMVVLATFGAVFCKHAGV